MNLIAVDPGARTGICCGRKTDPYVVSVVVNVNEPGGTVALADKLREAFLWMPRVGASAFLLVEKPVPMKGSIAFGNLSRIVGVVQAMADQYNVRWAMVAPMTWKASMPFTGEAPKKKKPKEYVSWWKAELSRWPELQTRLPVLADLKTTDEIDAFLIWQYGWTVVSAV